MEWGAKESVEDASFALGLQKDQALFQKDHHVGENQDGDEGGIILAFKAEDDTDDIDIDDDNNSKAAGEKETVYVDREVVVEKEVPVPVATPAPAPRKNYGGGANYNVGSWPETSQRYLDPSELYGMSAWEKKIMRNEIYARHGYIFQTRDMIEYFNAQPWYTPRTRNVRLSEIETYNVQLIKSVE